MQKEMKVVPKVSENQSEYNVSLKFMLICHLLRYISCRTILNVIIRNLFILSTFIGLKNCLTYPSQAACFVCFLLSDFGMGSIQLILLFYFVAVREDYFLIRLSCNFFET